MISRVAGCCFWLERYIERAENMARLLRVNRSFTLDLPVSNVEKHYPLIIVSGEQERFDARFPARSRHDADVVEEYLSWDEQNPVSIKSSVYWARENARTTREVISLEMWETINELWNFLRRGAGRRKYNTDRDAFFKRIKDGCDLLQAHSESTLLEGEPLAFIRLGRYLERTNQTARMLDVKHHTLGPSKGLESPVETAQWNALLRSCGASEAYFKHRPQRPDGHSIARFLLQEAALPRSVLGCLRRALDTLRHIQKHGHPSIGEEAEARLARLVEYVGAIDVEDGLHAALTDIIGATGEVGARIDDAYFHPSGQAALRPT